MENKLKILLCASEVVPFAKTGGLADVAGALPAAIEGLGHDVAVAKPKYRGVEKYCPAGLEKVTSLKVDLGIWEADCDILRGHFPGTKIPVYFFANDALFDREGLYNVGGLDYGDNLERFAFFSKAVLDGHQAMNCKPQIIHCNDWQTGLIPAYLRCLYLNDEYWRGMPTLFTVHNLAYQGVFPAEKFPLTGLGWEHFTAEGLEFHGNVNLMKGGLVHSDLINTVSKKYSQEIQTPEYGCGLEGLLKHRSNDLFGVLNGVDYNAWNPKTDEFLKKNFTVKDLRGKASSKMLLQKEHNLPITHTSAPMIGIISRLADQKGFDILEGAIEEIMRMELQLVILGTGEPKYHAMLERMSQSHPDRIAVDLKFDNRLAHLIEAGSDMFLMPSRFEPCGLNQMYSLKYGTVPIVRATGGLADTIVDATPQNIVAGIANGFVFEEYSSAALLDAMRRALQAYKDRKLWRKLMLTGMNQDFSWAASAREYVELYQAVIQKHASWA